MHLADLRSYLEAAETGCSLPRRRRLAHKAILNVAASGRFSSDRTVAEYATEIWPRPALPGRLAGRCHVTFPARRQAGTERDADRSGAALREYYVRKPDPAEPAQQISFGTSGHRGSPLTGRSTKRTSWAIAQAICDYRRRHGISGPLYMARYACGFLPGPAHCARGPGSERRQTVIQAATA